MRLDSRATWCTWIKIKKNKYSMIESTPYSLCTIHIKWNLCCYNIQVVLCLRISVHEKHRHNIQFLYFIITSIYSSETYLLQTRMDRMCEFKSDRVMHEPIQDTILHSQFQLMVTASFLALSHMPHTHCFSDVCNYLQRRLCHCYHRMKQFYVEFDIWVKVEMPVFKVW